jgi:pyridoxal phosphate enzyme (YggS family)
MTNEARSLAEVRENVEKTCGISRRKPHDVTLIAVSKTQSISKIEPLLLAGHRTFGENRVQEAMEKWPELRTRFSEVELHLIGQLQSNKADQAVQIFDFIHSLDRPSLAEALAKAMEKNGRRVPCFIQVNVGEEPQKGGCSLANLAALVEQCSSLSIPIIGLMCIPPSGIEPAPFFALLEALADENNLGSLSMGMSSDYETAIMLGATHIRVGTALFGERN